MVGIRGIQKKGAQPILRLALASSTSRAGIWWLCDAGGGDLLPADVRDGTRPNAIDTNQHYGIPAKRNQRCLEVPYQRPLSF